MAPTEAYKAFTDSLATGGSRALFVYDIEHWKVFTDDEKSQAEAILIERSTQHKDVRAIWTLAEIESQAAIAHIEPLCSDNNPSVRSGAKRALARLIGSDRAIAEMVDDTQTHKGTFDEIANAYYLKKLPGNAAIRGLFEALVSDAQLARLHAKTGLLERLGVPDTLLTPKQSPLWTQTKRLFLPYPSIYRHAGSTLQAIFAALGLGKTPLELGLIYQPGEPRLIARFTDRMKKDSPFYDTDAIAAMTGHDRDWAEMKLLWMIELESDSRALDALVELRLTHLLPALRDALQLREASAVPRAAEIEPFKRAIAELSG